MISSAKLLALLGTSGIVAMPIHASNTQPSTSRSVNTSKIIQLAGLASPTTPALNRVMTSLPPTWLVDQLIKQSGGTLIARSADGDKDWSVREENVATAISPLQYDVVPGQISLVSSQALASVRAPSRPMPVTTISGK